MEAIYAEVLNLCVAVLVAFVGVLTRYAVTYLNNKGVLAKLQTNKELVRIVVDATEQTYKTLDGGQKLDMAKIELVKLMNEKNLKISEKEIDMLIESLVKEMNDTYKKNK